MVTDCTIHVKKTRPQRVQYLGMCIHPRRFTQSLLTSKKLARLQHFGLRIGILHHFELDSPTTDAVQHSLHNLYKLVCSDIGILFLVSLLQTPMWLMQLSKKRPQTLLFAQRFRQAFHPGIASSPRPNPLGERGRSRRVKGSHGACG